MDNDADGRVDFPGDPGCAAGFGRRECLDTPASCAGVSLDPVQGYGHHGACDSWNGCIDAEGCANMACQFAGFDAAVSWREAHCSDPGLVCNLFLGNGMLDRDLDLGNCNLPVATEVVCR